MRTTITLDSDTADLVRKAMAESSGCSQKKVINDSIRQALGHKGEARGKKTISYPMGFNPDVPLDKSLRLASELEDGELIRKLSLKK